MPFLTHFLQCLRFKKAHFVQICVMNLGSCLNAMLLWLFFLVQVNTPLLLLDRLLCRAVTVCQLSLAKTETK